MDFSTGYKVDKNKVGCLNLPPEVVNFYCLLNIIPLCVKVGLPILAIAFKDAKVKILVNLNLILAISESKLETCY